MSSVTDGQLEKTYARLTELVGTSGPERRGRVLRRDFQRMALAAGDTENALYFRDDDPIAPHMFIPAMQTWGPGTAVDELRADGTGADKTSFLPLEGWRLMGGGQDLEFHAPVHDDTAIVFQSTLESVTRKEGSSGTFLLLTLTTIYHAEGGQPLLTARDTVIVR